MDFGIGSVVGITVIAYLVGMGWKAVDMLNDKYIPVVCGFIGAILGIVAMYTMPDFPASTGANQIGKQLF